MTARDRLILIAVVAVGILGVAWMAVVSPERKKAASINTQVASAESRLASAQGKLAEARQAEARYSAAYTSIVKLGKAVPAGEEVPSLIYQLAQASHRKNIDFNSIVSGSGSASSASASATTTAAASAGFTQMPFTFVFQGTFDDLYNLFQTLNRYTVRSANGNLDVSGRLLTIQATKLGSAPPASSVGGSQAPRRELTGTITATAYVLPADQGLTGGATATSPTGAATPASSSSAPSSTTPAAVAKVTP